VRAKRISVIIFAMFMASYVQSPTNGLFLPQWVQFLTFPLLIIGLPVYLPAALLECFNAGFAEGSMDLLVCKGLSPLLSHTIVSGFYAFLFYIVLRNLLKRKNVK